jgi:hypothetical protein
MAFRRALTAAVLLAGTHAGTDNALARSPTKIGTCAHTMIVAITDRFGDKIRVGTDADGSSTGAHVQFANRESQVSYEPVPAIARSRKGDRVLMCRSRFLKAAHLEMIEAGFTRRQTFALTSHGPFPILRTCAAEHRQAVGGPAGPGTSGGGSRQWGLI